jgi:hypothetical protein
MKVKITPLLGYFYPTAWQQKCHFPPLLGQSEIVRASLIMVYRDKNPLSYLSIFKAGTGKSDDYALPVPL